MNKLGTKLGAVAMSAVMALSFAPSAAITSLAAGGDDLTDATQLSVPVYRLYNPNSGEHLFTTNENECDSLDKNGWDYETIAWYAPSTGDPVFRLYNPNHPLGDHHYTSSEEERDNLIKQGWKLDATAFNTVAEGELLGAPVYSLYNPNAYDLGMATHHLTLSEEEADGLELLGWTNEGPKFYEYAEDLDPEVEELTVSIDNTTPKVGDTLTATVEGMAAASYEWAVSVDGEDWTVVDTETDETFDVTADLVGMYVKVTVTAEDEETASDVTVLPVEPAGELEIVSAEATAVDKIEVVFAEPQDDETTEVVLTKNDTEIDATVAWDDDGLVATITTTAKMTNGTYTVTATDAYENEDSADVEIESQHVDQIVITNETALTNATAVNGHTAHGEAYAYYDVLDQYGNSMRTGTSITWSGSAAKINYDKSTGKITMLKKADGSEAWTYSDKIYLTGVYTKTGTVCQAELSVGVEQALDTIEIAGFVKAGTTEIIDNLPADFKTTTYYLVYKVLDQNGAEMTVTNGGFPVIGTDVTFISDNVLLVSALTDPSTLANPQPTTVSINGEDYARVLVTPGLKVADGGEANITAIANKTGNKTIKNISVGGGVVLASFELQAPSGVLADGESIEIPFTATDTNGNPITNFVNIAKQKTFNTLSFNVSSGHLTLEEQADGTAKLKFTDDTDAPTWANAQATDGIDRKVSLTAIVTGGGTSNEMIDIQDRARPVAIKAVNMKEVFVESAKLADFTLNSFQYIDQYDRVIKGVDTTETWGDSTNFFASYTSTASGGSADFAGYVYGVRTSYSGNGGLVASATGATLNTTTTPLILTNTAVAVGAEPVKDIPPATATITTFPLFAGTGVTSTMTGENLKFEIVKADSNSTAWDAVSTGLTKSLTIVDISKVQGFEIGSLNRFYVGPVKATVTTNDVKTGDGILDTTGLADADELAALDFDTAVAVDATSANAKGLTDGAADYQQEVSVTGYFNGKEVSVPKNYFSVTGKKLGTNADPALAAQNVNKIDKLVTSAANGNPITLGDLYDKTSSRFTSKLGEDTLTATIYNITTFDPADMTAAATAYGQKLDTATKKVEFSDQAPKAAEFVGLKDSYTSRPTATVLREKADATAADRLGEIIGKHKAATKDDTTGDWYVIDQYGAFIEPNTATFRITNVTENPDGWAANNFKVTGNGSSQVVINGAERGDTFDVEVAFAGLSKTVSVTVGADKNAKIDSQAGNVWAIGLIGDGTDGLLEQQRLAGLS